MSDLTNQFVANVQAEARGFNTVVLAFANYGDETQVGLFKQCRHGSIDIKTTLHITVLYNLTPTTPRTEIKKIKLRDLLSLKTSNELRVDC